MRETTLSSGSSANYPWAERRVLVTGGAGFIGSALVWALNQRNCKNIVIADFATNETKRRNLAPLEFQEYLEPEDLLEKAQAGYLASFDYIFHLGACSSTTETDAAYLRRNNFEYTKILAENSLRAGKRFVYASSAATYGDGSAGMDDFPYEGLEKLRPLNLYGESKHLFDLEAWKHGWLDRIVGLKYFNQSYRAEFADGEQKRDFLYVKDAVEMTLHLADTSSANGLFNIGSGRAHSWNELADAVFSALGKAPSIEYVEMPLQIREKYQYFTQANTRRLLASGYSRPITALRDAIQDYVVNYLVPGRVLGE